MKIENDKKVDRGTQGPAQEADRIPAFLGEPLDPATMTVPRGSLSRHLALSAKLQAQRPQVLSPEQTRRLESLTRASDIAHRALEATRRKRPRDLALVRGEAVSISGTITAALRLFATSRLPQAARRAATLREALLPRDVTLTRLTPEELWLELDTMRTALTQDPELRATLLGFVPEEAVTSLFEVTDRLGQAAGMMDAQEVAAPTDRARAHDYLVRTMNGYLLSIAAAVDEDDAGSLDVVRAALAPIAEFRAANARRKTRAAATEEVEEEDEVDAGEDGPGDAEASAARGVAETATATGVAGAAGETTTAECGSSPRWRSIGVPPDPPRPRASPGAALHAQAPVRSARPGDGPRVSTL